MLHAIRIIIYVKSYRKQRGNVSILNNLLLFLINTSLYICTTLLIGSTSIFGTNKHKYAEKHRKIRTHE